MKFLAAFLGLLTLIALLATPRPAGAAEPAVEGTSPAETRFEEPVGTETGPDFWVGLEIGPRF